MRRLISASLVIAALSAGGCRFCQGPDDYCGPVYWDGVPVIGFCERHNSILSPGSFSSSGEMIEGETIEGEGPTEEYVIESIDEGPTNQAPQESAPPQLQLPPLLPSPAQPPQQWAPPRKEQTPPKGNPTPAPIRTTRMN